MNLSRITVVLFLFVSVCSTSCLKNDRDGSSLNSDTNSLRPNRRISLNEYLVPPPLPKPHSTRTGRLENSSPMESPGYFSQFMNWLNPFNFGPTPPTHSKSSPFIETPHPPHSYSPPPLDLHPPLPLAPSFHHSSGRQPDVPLYPPLGPPPAQHSNPLLSTPPGLHPGPLHSLPPGPPLSLPPGPPLNPPPRSPSHFYNVPPINLHDKHPSLSLPNNGHSAHLLPIKGKACNSCNKVPWIPMQGAALVPENYPPPSQVSNAYLPPSNQASHDIQHSASNEFRIPDFSQQPIEQNGQQSLNSPILYPEPLASLHNAASFDSTPQNPSYSGIVSHFEPPPLPTIIPGGRDQRNHEMNNEHYNVHGNDDLTFSGTQVNQGHSGVISQNLEPGVNKDLFDYKGSLGSAPIDSHQPISGSFDQGYSNNPPKLEEENGEVLNQPVQHSQNGITNLGLPHVENHNFVSQSGNEYSFKSNTGENTGVHYLSSDQNYVTSLGSSSFYNRDVENINYQYSDDLSPSGSVLEDSHVQTETSVASSPSINKGQIHFEQSPLLDLTKKEESRTDAHWSTSTNDYTNDDKLSYDIIKTTTDYSLDTDNVYFEDSSSFVRPTESYSSSVIRNVNSVFGPSTSTVADFPNTNSNQKIETSTINSQYKDQQQVSYIPPSEQPGYLWPSLLLNTINSRNESSKNQQTLNHLAQRNNSFLGIKNFVQQDSWDSKDTKDTLQKQQNVKRNKQVQVIIPYTSDYTPIPFQQSHGDWSIKTNFDRTLGRKIPPRNGLIADNYVQQESRNDIRVINQLQSQFNINQSNKLNSQTPRPNAIENVKTATTKANNSIDVRRLQKNIDNWTIQEYSKPTTSSTILPSSLHPYLLPSKKIPTEYLTTTEPGDHSSQSKDHNESVKTYSLAGFSFNEVEHEVSASNRIEETRAPVSVVRIDSPKATASGLQGISKSTTGQKSTWGEYSVSISPVNKERVYVVTPQSVLSSKNDFKLEKGKGKNENVQGENEAIIDDANESKNNLSEFEAIEKAYQVLPQAVNSLAVASTGKENIPLWGIMEHEEFVSLNLHENDEEMAEDVGDGPVLYTGHSKVINILAANNTVANNNNGTIRRYHELNDDTQVFIKYMKAAEHNL